MRLLPAGGVRRFVRRAIFYRGLSRGGAWLGLSAALWGGRRVRRFFGRTEQRVGTLRLPPNTGLALATGVPASRRQRRRARRVARRAGAV